jgi:hypothetical protein
LSLVDTVNALLLTVQSTLEVAVNFPVNYPLPPANVIVPVKSVFPSTDTDWVYLRVSLSEYINVFALEVSVPLPATI